MSLVSKWKRRLLCELGVHDGRLVSSSRKGVIRPTGYFECSRCRRQKSASRFAPIFGGWSEGETEPKTEPKAVAIIKAARIEL